METVAEEGEVSEVVSEHHRNNGELPVGSRLDRQGSVNPKHDSFFPRLLRGLSRSHSNRSTVRSYRSSFREDDAQGNVH